MPTATDVVRFFRCQAFGKTFIPKVDLSGRTIVVTGANTGLGFDACKHLARLKVSRLILAVRSPEKGDAARSRILTETGCKDQTSIEVWLVDLEDYASIRSFAQRVNTQLDQLDGFVANAGVELTKFDKCQDLEKTLTVNVVSTYYLAQAVLPKLEETARKFGIDTRLTIVGSLIHYFGADNQIVGDQPLLTLSDPKTADMSQRYPLSKLLVHLMFEEFIKTIPKSKDSYRIIVNLVNPGWCGTELGRSKDADAFEKSMFRLIGRTSEEGSRTLVHGVTAGPETHGKYLSECEIKPQSSYMQSEKGRADAVRVWKDSSSRIQKIDIE